MIKHNKHKEGRRKSFLVFFLALTLGASLFYTSVAEAITTDKSEYWSDEGILVSGAVDPVNPLFLYNLNQASDSICKTYQAQTDGAGSLGLLAICSVTGDYLAQGSYSLIELSGRRSSCSGLSYSQCGESATFVGEATFSTKGLQPPPEPVIIPTGAGVSSEPESVPSPSGGGGPTSYRPEVSIYSPLDGKAYGTNTEIIYEATDKNDTLGQRNLGIAENSVTIYYSKTSDTRQRTQIGSSLPSKGVFKWNTKDLPEGDTYNIIISAKDKVNEIGESVSGNFSIDHTFPVFTVKTNPTITRGEDVEIIVESSKELPEPPVVKVNQYEFNYFSIPMEGDGTRFTGVYKVIGGYDGPAKIEVSGKDTAGNESSLIVSGGQFSVGILPPPKPIILSPLDRDIAPSGTINVKVKARKDTEVILSLNGDEKISKNPNETGEYLFENIKLRPEFNYGNNIISIISKDVAGNISESTDLNLKYNISPEIFIESPVKGQNLTTITPISIKASDRNRDKLKFVYEVSSDNGDSWIKLPVFPERRYFDWDTTIFPDGDYRLRVTVSDGTSEKIATVDGLVVKNLLPTFSFEDGIRTVTNKKNINIAGTVVTSTKLPLRPNILSVEYSLDGGSTWDEASIISGALGPESKFSIALELNEEKVYKINLRAKDDRDIFGRGEKVIVAIFEPPFIPTVTSLKNGDVISDSMDLDSLSAGIQVAIVGDSKPGTKVTVVVGEQKFTSKTNLSGRYSINDVTLRVHGSNTLEIYAEDEAGNKSGSNSLSLVYNNPPIIKFISPRPNRGLNHNAVIEFSVFDPDGDEIKRTMLSLKKAGESVFRSLDVNSLENKLEFNVSNFKEGGGYKLRIESTDGVSPTTNTIDFFVDNTKPGIFLNSIPNRIYKKDFRFEAVGTASDSLSGVEFVEYSLDEDHWFKAVITRGFLGKRASFRIRHPFTLDDGEYDIKIRSVDAAGNQSDIWLEKIIVDSMPPRLGGYEMSFNGNIIYPEELGFNIAVGSIIKIRASLEADTTDANLSIDDFKIELSQASTGVWEGQFIPNKIGSFDIKYSAKDSFENIIENKTIGVVNVLNRGIVSVQANEDTINKEVIGGAEITVYIFSEDRQRFERWPGEYYNTENPAISDTDGSYSLFLPPGKYQIGIHKTGFVKTKTNEFSLNNGQFIFSDFEMKKREGFRGLLEDLLEKIMIF